MATSFRRLTIFLFFMLTFASAWKLLKLTILEDTPDFGIGLLSALRALAFALWIGPFVYSWWMKQPLESYKRIALFSGIGFIVFDFVLIWMRATDVLGNIFPFFNHDFIIYLTETHNGVNWLIRAGLTVITILLIRQKKSIQLLFLGLISLELTYSGHPGSSNLWWLAVPLDMLHQWFYGIWIGGLLLLAWMDRSKSLRSGKELSALYVMRFSQLAKWCVLVLVLTGILSAIDRFWPVTKVFNTDFSHVLSIKMIFSLIALVAAGGHLLFIQPRLNKDKLSLRVHRWFGKALRLEIAALLLVLFVTGTLINSSLPDPNALQYDELVKDIFIQPPLHRWAFYGLIGILGLIFAPTAASNQKNKEKVRP